MSRVEFRAEVPDARPPSAWLLVSVAGATLWVTEQLRPWAIALQAAAIVYSLATRRRPGRWQMSDITLNIGMFGIVGATIALALEGHPATVSLAHFAALTSGLQLLDTRPRKSEFLLVALSLFQVILAANLTDNVFFPPLLVLFLIAATWTLMVHTLRTEAIEAGDRAGAGRAINSGLLKLTLAASAVSVLMALVLFVMLPRMRASMLKGGVGTPVALAGFSDNVELGTIGRIRKDPTVVLRVETLEGPARAREAAYWRGLAFDHFDGRRWSISRQPGVRERIPVPGVARFGLGLNGGSDRGVNRVQRVIREPVEAGVVFAAGLPRHLEGPIDALELDPNGGLYAARQVDDRVRYTISTWDPVWDDETLARDRAAPPDWRSVAGRGPGERYLALPALGDEVAALARRIAAPAETDAARARALERWLRANGRYTDAPPDLGDDPDRSPVERFLLGELSGHCEYFASSMVVLARSLELPARLVNGFAGGRENTWGGFIELARSDAHTWVEIHYEDSGWVAYDPTPPDLRLRADGALGLGERLGQLYSVVELWWFQRVVDFDSSDQIRALRSAWHAWRDWREKRAPESATGVARPTFDLERLRELPWAVIGASLGLLGLVIETRRRSRRTGRDAPLPVAYERALALLHRRGLVRAPATTARHFAAEARDQLGGDAGRAFTALTEAYLSERFGRRPDARAAAHLESLREALAARPPAT